MFECLPVVEIDTTVKPVKSRRLVEKKPMRPIINSALVSLSQERCYIVVVS